MNDTKIAIIGLGYVGLPLAVEFGRRFQVVGFDISAQRIAELRDGRDSTLEVATEDLCSAVQLTFSHDPADLTACSVFIVTVPTPIDDANRPDLRPLIRASETVGAALREHAIVIYESTVFPGCTEEVCVPILEKISGLRYNKDFFCGYSPERINPGDKVNTLTKICKITSGSTPAVADIIDQLYSAIITAGTFKAASIKVAEAAKVMENTQRDLNIALVNELSVISHHLGIDAIDVLEAAGSKWNFLPFRPGMVGGHCIGVDPYYLTHKAEQLGYTPQVILAGRRINDDMANYAARKIVQLMLRNGIDVARSRVGLFGITFKENCPDIRNSKIVDLVRELQQWSIEVLIEDPWANPDEVSQEYGLELVSLADQGLFDSVIVAVGHRQYRNYDPSFLRGFCQGKNPILGDLKAIYDRQTVKDAGFTVFRL